MALDAACTALLTGECEATLVGGVNVMLTPDVTITFSRAAMLSPAVVLDLAGAKTLTLEVDYGENYDVQDRFNWIEPALLRSKPAPPASTSPSTQP